MNKLFKRSAIVVVALVGAIVVGTTAFAAGRWVQAYQDDTLKIKFNGVVQNFTDPEDGSKIVPLIFNERTYLPVRAIATLAGLGVDYDEATHSVVLTAATKPVIEEQPKEKPPEKPLKDSQAFNSGVKKTYVDAIKDKSNFSIKPGKYTNSSYSGNARRLVQDDFKSLTQYGFDVTEYLAESDEDYTYQSCYLYVNSESYAYPVFSVDDRIVIGTKLYKNLVDTAKSNGWVVKKEGSDTSSYDGKAYPKVYMYKDGLYCIIESYLGNVKLFVHTYDVGMN